MIYIRLSCVFLTIICSYVFWCESLHESIHFIFWCVTTGSCWAWFIWLKWVMRACHHDIFRFEKIWIFFGGSHFEKNARAAYPISSSCLWITRIWIPLVFYICPTPLFSVHECLVGGLGRERHNKKNCWVLDSWKAVVWVRAQLGPMPRRPAQRTASTQVNGYPEHSICPIAGIRSIQTLKQCRIIRDQSVYPWCVYVRSWNAISTSLLIWQSVQSVHMPIYGNVDRGGSWIHYHTKSTCKSYPKAPKKRLYHTFSI